MQSMKQTLDRYLTEDEERLLMRTVRSRSSIYARRDAAWMQLLRQTGIRVGTLSRLTVFDARCALRDHTLRLRSEICKRRNGYNVPANRKARQALKALLAVRREMGFPEFPDAPLIVSRKHQPLSIRSFQRRLQLWRVEAGLNLNVSPHWFRHTVGQRIMQRSTAANPLLHVQAALGHSNIKSTAIYTRPSREQVADTMEEIA